MPKNKEPENLTMLADLDIDIQAAASSKSQYEGRKFKINAYNGGDMMLSVFYDPAVIDLDGLTSAATIPLLLNHDAGIESVMGSADKIDIKSSGVKVAGKIIAKSNKAQLMVDTADAGLKLQASVGVSIIRREYVEAGESVKVNGKNFNGPLVVVREGNLREVSLVVLGADNNTSALVAEDKIRSNIMLKPKKDTEKIVVESADEQDANLEASANKDEAKGTKEPVVDKMAATDIQAAAPVATETKPVSPILEAAAKDAETVAAAMEIFGDKHPEIMAKALRENWNEDKMNLEVLRAERPQVPNAIVRGGSKLNDNIIEAAAFMSTGGYGVTDKQLVSDYGEETIEAAEKFRGIGIRDMIRLCARAEGIELPVFSGTGTEFIRAAFSTLSLPGILANVANKSLLQGYNYTEDVWRQVCKIASVKDFKQHTRYRMTSDMLFKKVGADGELKHGELDEQTFTNQADTYGRMFSLTRQMIINDDLSAFTAIPFDIGLGAGEAVALAVWTLLLSNPSSFFHANNSNYLAGSTTALGVDSLKSAEQLFLDQTKPNGRPLGISPRYLLVPTALAGTAKELYVSRELRNTTASTKWPTANIYSGKYDPIVSAYLANSGITGYSALAWYLFADPNILAALEVAFLNGVDRPTVEKADADFNTLGIQFRGYLDFGVKEQDPRAAVKMKGET